MENNQVILSDSDSTVQITKTILQDAADKSAPSPATDCNDCNMCCTKVLHTTTTTEALVNSSLNRHPNLAHIHNNGSLDRPVGSEPQTLQQAVVELVEVEEKKVFANEYFTLANSTEPIQIPTHFNHGHHHHHHHNITTATTNTNTIINNNIKRVPVKTNRQGHITERPFGCHICGFAFSRNDHLVRHVNSHHKAKNFKCDICGKALSRRDHLKVHLRIHSGERPYKCTICGFAFSRHDHLVKHNQPNKGRRKLSCVPQAGLKTEPEVELPMVTTPVAMTTESGEIVIAQAQVQAQPQQLPQQLQPPQTQQAVSHVEVLNQQLVTTATPTTATTATDNIVTPTTLSLQTANTNGTIEIISQPQQQQIYQTISTPGSANTVQVYPVTQIFPTTFQVSPTTAQIFPTTIQMNATTAQIIPLQMYPITTQIAAASVYPKQ